MRLGAAVQVWATKRNAAHFAVWLAAGALAVASAPSWVPENSDDKFARWFAVILVLSILLSYATWKFFQAKVGRKTAAGLLSLAWALIGLAVSQIPGACADSAGNEISCSRQDVAAWYFTSLGVAIAFISLVMLSAWLIRMVTSFGDRFVIWRQTGIWIPAASSRDEDQRVQPKSATRTKAGTQQEPVNNP